MKVTNGKSNSNQNHDNEQLPPITLSFIVFTCSSIVFILCLRDFWMTGKNIFGNFDHQYMVCFYTFSWSFHNMKNKTNLCIIYTNCSFQLMIPKNKIIYMLNIYV
jgi:hypothetical protein